MTITPTRPTASVESDGEPVRRHWTDLAASSGDLVPALVAGLGAWLSVASWHGMAESAHLFLVPLLFATVVLVVLGWGVRRYTGSAGWGVVAQVLVVGEWLLHHVTGSWLPTPGALGDFGGQLVDGALAGQRYVSPVSLQHPEFQVVLLLGGLGIVLAVDLIAITLRQAALAGLPLLLSITISASVLLRPVSWILFALCAICWLSVIAIQESGRIGSWGRANAGGEVRRSLTRVGSIAVRIGLACVVVAVLLTAGLTSQGRELGNFGGGNGNGSLSAANPMLDMRRNLRQGRNVPLVQVTTTDDPSYLRLTTLDQFDDNSWRPSDLRFDNTSVLAGSLPPPPGLSPSNQGPGISWRLQVSKSFATRWLPLPFPTSILSIPGKWRYTPDDLDVVAAGQDTAAGVSYQLTSYDPLVDANALRAAGPAPETVIRRETQVPADLPLIFKQTARAVTGSATNDYDRAVALQNWFRNDGGFVYSTKPASGTGVGTLERFITSDKVGYCEQFSTAMAVMARTLGIPARVSVGFLRPEKTGRSTYTYGVHDLHAWPELYFSGVGWIRFEPTPSGRTGSPPQYTAPIDQPTQTTGPSNTANPSAKQNQAKPTIAPNNSDSGGSRGGGFPWRLAVAVLVLALLVVLALVPRLIRRTTSRRRWSAARSPEALADAAWTEVRATAVDLDLPWSDLSTVRTNANAVQRDVANTLEARDALRDVVTMVELTRYARPGQGGESPAELRVRLQADVRTWQEEMFRLVDPRRVRRARWLPGSVLRRRGR